MDDFVNACSQDPNRLETNRSIMPTGAVPTGAAPSGERVSRTHVRRNERDREGNKACGHYRAIGVPYEIRTRVPTVKG